MSHAQAQFRLEPEEREDPLNRLLDAFDTQVEALIAQGLKPQLEARLSRHFPPAPTPPDRTGVDVARALDLAKLLTTCRMVQRFRISAEEASALKGLKDWLIAEIGKANGKTEGQP